MKLMATSDLHLTLSVPEKNMEKFGDCWKDHANSIVRAWEEHVGKDDIVIIAGDISWATNIEQARKDFDFIEALPGKKIITVGNHDYWHQTASKSNNWFFYNYKTIVPLTRNDYMPIYGVALCAVRGYMNENHPEFKPEYRKGYNRECKRLELTLRDIPSVYSKVILVSHYPPIHNGYMEGDNTVINIMKRYKVDTCIYGHLHAEATSEAYIGDYDGMNFKFVAGDSHRFVPQLILEEL